MAYHNRHAHGQSAGCVPSTLSDEIGEPHTCYGAKLAIAPLANSGEPLTY